MVDYPKVGSIWKYAGVNPTIRNVESGSLLGNPSFEVLPPHTSGYSMVTGEVIVRATNSTQRALVYTYQNFSRYFIPHNGIISEQLASFRALLSEAVFQGVTKEEIYDVLVALEL